MEDIEKGQPDNPTSSFAVTDEPQEAEKKGSARCSICTRRAGPRSTYLIEPLGVPEPRQSWTLCKRCSELLLIEMERSPVLSPLRLRIAMGIVAADRSPYIYAPTHKPMSDRNWIVIIAWLFGIAMLLHLVLIVMLAYIAGH
ncbi:MAG TPA: hypothetical protein VIZ18_08580 [Ktedonobacteraceae bacterium]